MFNKKAQLMALEFKIFIIALLVGLVIGFVGLALLIKFGMLDFAKDIICNCAKK